MKKIALLKCSTTDDSYGESTVTVLDTMWYDVEDTEYELLRANLYKLGSYPFVYRMVDYVPQEEVRDVLAVLRELIAKDEADRVAQAARRRVAVAASEAVKIERKRKQLEKLKKELGDA